MPTARHPPTTRRRERVEVDGDRTTVEVIGRGPLPELLVVDVVTQALPDAPLSCGDRPKAHVAQRATVRP